MKVLQVGLGAKQGGIESCIVNYYTNIDRETVQFDFADIFGGGTAYSEKIKSCGGQIFTIENCKKHPCKAWKALRGVICKGEYDVVHINVLSAANLLPVFAALSTRKSAIVVHSHNSSVPGGILRKVLNTLNMPILRLLPVEKWACSRKAGNWLWGKNFQKDNVIPNAVDRNVFQFDADKRRRMRKKCGFADNELALGYVGRLIEQKNPLFLIDILDSIKKIIPEVKLLVVGDGPLNQAFQEKADCFQLRDYIYFAGSQKEPSDWYQAMDIFLLPSIFEGLPVVGIEAQAVGLKCLVSDLITKELNITGMVRYLPIDKGAGIWAEEIQKVFREGKSDDSVFPDEYEIRYAAKRLQKKYVLLSNRE